METIKELRMEELDQVSGGALVCVFIGGSNDGANASACYASGTGSDGTGTKEGCGAGICYYIGIGFGCTGKENGQF